MYVCKCSDNNYFVISFIDPKLITYSFSECILLHVYKCGTINLFKCYNRLKSKASINVMYIFYCQFNEFYHWTVYFIVNNIIKYVIYGLKQQHYRYFEFLCFMKSYDVCKTKYFVNKRYKYFKLVFIQTYNDRFILKFKHFYKLMRVLNYGWQNNVDKKWEHSNCIYITCLKWHKMAVHIFLL